MKLALSSHTQLQEFLREHTGKNSLRLPHIQIYTGRFARFLTRALKVGAITVGRRIFLSPQLLERDAEGRINAPGWLIAHESVHVVQYMEAGYLRFFFRYLRGYFKALRATGRWDSAARMAAYLAIAEECEAHQAEDAYRAWSNVQAEKAE